MKIDQVDEFYPFKKNDDMEIDDGNKNYGRDRKYIEIKCKKT